MPALFKDFEKDVNDFFDKYYQKGTKGFKLENKGKGADQTVYVNNGFEENVFTVNFQYDIKAKGLKTKLGFTNDGKTVFKGTLEKKFTCGDQKFEFQDTFSNANIFDWSGEFVHEWKFGPAALYSKSKYNAKDGIKSDINVSAEVPGVDGLALGGSINFAARKKAFSKFKLGAQYKAAGYLFAGAYTPANGDTTASFLVPLKGVFLGNDVDVNVNYKKVTPEPPKDGKPVVDESGVYFGLSTKCPITGANLRLKSDLAGQYGVSFIRAFPNNLTVGLGVEGSVFDLGKCPADKLAFSVVRD